MQLTDKEVGRFISANYGIIHKLLNTYISDEWHADVQQDILLEFVRALPRYRGDCKLQTYLHVIGLKKCMTWRREQRLKRIRMTAYNSLNHDTVATIHNVKPKPKIGDLVDEFLDSLEDGLEKWLFRDRYLYDISFDQLSVWYDIPANTAAVKVLRLRNKFAKQYKQKF